MRPGRLADAAPLAALLLLCACGSGGDPGSGADPGGTGTGHEASAAAQMPDACNLFSKAELETAIGAELRDGEPQSAPDPSESQCRFRRQLGRDATRSFPDPAIPTTVGVTGVTVSASPAEAARFAEGRDLAGGERVAGVGDDAFFVGPNLLHVRKGSTSFSLRIEPQAASPADQAKVREAMLGLARTGASRL